MPVLVLSLTAGLLAQDAPRGAGPSTPAERTKQAFRLARQLEAPERCSAAWRGLLELGEPAATALAVSLKDPRPEVAIRAADVLARLGPAGAAALPDLEKIATAAPPDLAHACRLAIARIRWRGQLVVDYSAKARFVDAAGKVQEVGHATSNWHIEPVADGHWLASDYATNVVSEFDAAGKAVWTFKDVSCPYDVERLPNGNTMIADGSNNRVVEIDARGEKIVAVLGDLKRPVDVDRLPDGHLLVTEFEGGQVVELDEHGVVRTKWEGLGNPMSAERLANGNTLVACWKDGKVVELDSAGAVVWSVDLPQAQYATRLVNGNTLAAATSVCVEFDGKGKEVWREAGSFASQILRQ